jgi:hypothetical protein
VDTSENRSEVHICKDLKCGAGEEWRSVGPIVREMKKYYTESRITEIDYYNKKKKR